MTEVLRILSVGIGTLLAIVLAAVFVFWFIEDVTQKKHAVLRNYPVIGRLRYFFEKIAPLNNADKINKPLMVVQGLNDPRVPYTEAEQIVATMKKRDKPVWSIMAKDEGHGFAKKKNQDFQFLATLVFVEKYLLN